MNVWSPGYWSCSLQQSICVSILQQPSLWILLRLSSHFTVRVTNIRVPCDPLLLTLTTRTAISPIYLLVHEIVVWLFVDVSTYFSNTSVLLRTTMTFLIKFQCLSQLSAFLQFLINFVSLIILNDFVLLWVSLQDSVLQPSSRWSNNTCHRHSFLEGASHLAFFVRAVLSFQTGPIGSYWFALRTKFWVHDSVIMISLIPDFVTKYTQQTTGFSSFAQLCLGT